LKMLAGTEAAVAADLAGLSSDDGSRSKAVEKLRGPSATWTYLLNEDQFGWGLEILKGRNIGFGSVAAGVFGPLFLLTLASQRLKRWFRKRYSPELPDDGTEKNGKELT
jgi:hypothetical protein